MTRQAPRLRTLHGKQIRRPATLLVLCISLVFTLCPLGYAQPLADCVLGFNRQVGRLSQYNWVCVCPWKNGPKPFRAIGLASIQAPPPGHDTQGRGLATARCAARATPRLTHLCRANATAFEHAATRTLTRCISHEPLTCKERRLRGPFIRTYNTDSCRADFVNLVGGGRRSGSWLCECQQRFDVLPNGAEFITRYDVLPGVAEFITKGTREATNEEWALLDACTGPASIQLKEVCAASPGDFEILSLHLLQACCKRVRVAFKSKFECAVVVPDDLRAFKIANNDLS